VAIIERGRLIEVGSPGALVRKHCPEHAIVFTSDAAGIAERFQRLPVVRSATSSGATHTIRGEGDDFVTDVIHVIACERLHVRGFRTEFPTLEDVFLKLTGHTIRD
jgi:ABC-2 type transport system ATP-binding protein